MLLIAFTAGVTITVIAMQWTQGIMTAVTFPALDNSNADKLQPEKANLNLFGLAKPNIQNASWDSSEYVSERGSFTSGVSITVLIENTRSKPISEIKFAVEQRGVDHNLGSWIC